MDAIVPFRKGANPWSASIGASDKLKVGMDLGERCIDVESFVRNMFRDESCAVQDNCNISALKDNLPLTLLGELRCTSKPSTRMRG